MLQDDYGLSPLHGASHGIHGGRIDLVAAVIHSKKYQLFVFHHLSGRRSPHPGRQGRQVFLPAFIRHIFPRISPVMISRDIKIRHFQHFQILFQKRKVPLRREINHITSQKQAVHLLLIGISYPVRENLLRCPSQLIPARQGIFQLLLAFFPVQADNMGIGKEKVPVFPLQSRNHQCFLLNHNPPLLRRFIRRFCLLPRLLLCQRNLFRQTFFRWFRRRLLCRFFLFFRKSLFLVFFFKGLLPGGFLPGFRLLSGGRLCRHTFHNRLLLCFYR